MKVKFQSRIGLAASTVSAPRTAEANPGFEAVAYAAQTVPRRVKTRALGGISRKTKTELIELAKAHNIPVEESDTRDKTEHELSNFVTEDGDPAAAHEGAARRPRDPRMPGLSRKTKAVAT